MPESPMTVRRLFFGARHPASSLGRRVGRERQLDDLREALSKEIGKAQWKLVAREVGRQIAQVIDFGVADKILAPAWQKLEMLQEYRDPEAHPPEESALVPLVEHTVKSTHRPHIDLMVKEVEIGRLELAVDLSIELQGVLLRIQDGRILAVEAGSASGGGRLACSYGEQEIYSLERRSRTFRLDHGVGFGEGLAIPPLDL